METIKLECSCGKVEGVAKVRPDNGRVACCCANCQGWAEWLRDDILDQYGGTDIYQMPLSNLEIKKGVEFIGCGRMSEKGMFRFYTTCCRTPVGNTISAKFPFIGIPTAFVSDPDFERLAGPAICYVNLKAARGKIPAELKPRNLPLRYMFRSLVSLTRWKLAGLHTPTALFVDDKPVAEPEIVR